MSTELDSYSFVSMFIGLKDTAEDLLKKKSKSKEKKGQSVFEKEREKKKEKRKKLKADGGDVKVSEVGVILCNIYLVF